MGDNKKKISLLLTGGGARAAYQVGVLKAISEWYPRVHHSPFSIYCGTSAGAINTASLATHATCFRLGIKKLDWFWSRLHTGKVFYADSKGILNHLSTQWYARFKTNHVDTLPFGLLDNHPLRELLDQVINYSHIEHQITSGALHGLSITTSSYKTGKSVSFYQANDSIKPWRTARSIGKPSYITSEHLLASSAIPLVFPASRIGSSYYGDGSIHQLAPLRPSLKMGADKIFIINLSNSHTEPAIDNHPPGLAEIGGHLMDTIFSDTLEADIEHLHNLNHMIEKVPDAKESRDPALKHIDVFQLSPSKPFEPLAKKYYLQMPVQVRLLMKLLGISPKEDASITSYLLFEPDYIQALIQLGYQDALNKKRKIQKFLEIDPDQW
ncbi:patatin-like phospholipase family protein [Vibrio sp. Of7-15]|uniref:patatin-like phospholipase family protein n=1 Tax=Vibrio sp. Of7-15 TaxID=2724879 RepID=UPI001EF20E89|nr:patatin-like phospholipase family protein [Vibrio sp. Of7-15]MCG7498632.1 patatin-like phospholipase family protein [Vibrio sp. Of7-15]